MTRLTLTRTAGRGRYRLVDGAGRERGQLRADRRFRHGEAVTAQGTVPVHGQGFRRRTASAGDERAPVIVLAEPTATLVFPPPWPGGAAQWLVGCERGTYRATLTAPGRAMRLTFPRGRSGGTVDVDGDWPQRDLVALTAGFALLARQHGDTQFTAAVVAIATSGSPGAR